VVRPRLRGQAFVVRYADDIMIAFDREIDASRVMAVLAKRFGRFGLRLHPRKTRRVEFHQPRWSQLRRGPRQGSFDLLGFTHYWARSRRGTWVVRRRTAGDRFRRATHALGQWCRAHRHLPIAMQHELLSIKLRGHDAHYGITGIGTRSSGCVGRSSGGGSGGCIVAPNVG
jgi:RNA-directed DNA polymerase